MKKRLTPIGAVVNSVAIAALLLTSACAFVDVPDSRNVQIPSPTSADQRKTAVNERPDSVMYLPLGEDVLVPDADESDVFPSEMVGPFELRGETLAGALQLILADYDISLAFETQEGLTRRVTVANLRGDLGKVVNQVCSLANLYCSYEDGTITVKDTQTFTVTLPPIGTRSNSSGNSSSGDSGSGSSSSSSSGSNSGGSSSSGSGDTDFLDDVAEGLAAILGPQAEKPIVDPTTRTIVYTATQRTADIANRYFQRLRANTAMIVFETYIWEVSLNSGNSTGVDWFKLASFGKFNSGISMTGGLGADFTSPISIGLPTSSGSFDGATGDLLKFLSQFGAVKTISQPQITVLSGSEAELRVADTQNYVAEIATTLTDNNATTSVNTDSVDTGFTLTIGSTWDKSTVYANVDLELTDVKQIDDFAFADTSSGGGSGTGRQTRIQLPQTSERQLSTQIRVRPGDSVLIAGLVRENDNFNEDGVGFMQPFLPKSRTAQTQNLELVILLRPRVVVYTAANDKRYVDYAMKKHKVPGAQEPAVSEADAAEKKSYRNIDAVEDKSESLPVVDPVEERIPAGMPAPLSAPAMHSAPRISHGEKTPVQEPVSEKPAPVTSVPVPPPAEKAVSTVSKAPEPEVVKPVVSAPVAKPAPATKTAPVSSVYPASGMTPEPAPKPILKTAPAAPVAAEVAPADGARFTRGTGFVSKSVYPVPPQPAASELKPATPGGSVYETYDATSN